MATIFFILTVPLGGLGIWVPLFKPLVNFYLRNLNYWKKNFTNLWASYRPDFISIKFLQQRVEQKLSDDSGIQVQESVTLA
jgi:hypothetical protein